MAQGQNQGRRATDKCGGNSDIERCPLADEAAAKAVRDVFAILGVNVDDPEKVEEFRKSLRFSDELRKTYRHGVLAIVALIGASVWAAFAAGVRIKLGG